MSIILPNENERRSRLDDILYALCTLSLLDEYDVPNEDRINEYYKALLTGDLSELTFMPKSRIEKLLHFLTIGTDEGIEAPKSRIEYLLYVLAGLMQVSTLPFNVDERSSRHEKYLMYLIENGGVGVKSLTVSFFNNQEILNSKEGSVENLTFKGNTILPVIKENVLSEEVDVANVERFDNEYEGEFKSAILKGMTVNCLLSLKNITANASAYNYTRPLNVGETYTIFYNYTVTGTDMNIVIGEARVGDSSTGILGTAVHNGKITEGTHIGKKVVTLTDASSKILINWIRFGTGTLVVNEFYCVEGDYSNIDIPFIPSGLNNVKMPVLTTTGKNLVSKTVRGTQGSQGNILYWEVYRGLASEDLIKVKKGETYQLSGEPMPSETYAYATFDINKIFLGMFWGSTYNVSDDVSFVRTFMIYNKDTDLSNATMQLEENSVATSYEPYKSNILTTNEEVELRGIGDVKDELNLITGELTECIGEVIYDGSDDENWKSIKMDTTPDNIGFYLPLENCLSNTDHDRMKLLVKDNLGFTKNCFSGSINDAKLNGKNGFSIHSNGNVYFTTPLSECGGLTEWKAKLKQRPLILQYALKQKPVKTVDLNIVDHNDNTLEKMSTFKDGHIILSSEEGTLIPSLTYSVARDDAFELTNLKSNNTYTVQTNEKEFTLNGVTYPEIETSATTTASVDRVISIDDIYARVDNVEKMVLEGTNYGNLLQESGQDEFVSHASDENQTITINDTVEGRLKDLTLKGDTLVNILPSESTLRNEMTNSYSQKLNNGYDEVIVVDGEYKDLNVEGRTLLNLASVQNDSETNFYVVGEELNGQSIEIEQKSAILEGMTLVNLATRKRFYNGAITYGEYLTQPLKNNTKYLLVFDDIENVEEVSLTTIDWITHQSVMSGATLKTKCVFTFNVSSPSIVTNIRVLLTTTPPQTPDYKIMLIEYQEGMENWDIPYFDGMQFFDYSVPRNLKDVTLEGSTYISKTASLINSMNNISMQKINEGYDDVNVVDGEFKSAILKGQTLVNLFSHYSTGGTVLNNGVYTNTKDEWVEPVRTAIPVKNNVDYTVSAKIKTTVNNIYIRLDYSGGTIAKDVLLYGTITPNQYIYIKQKVQFDREECVRFVLRMANGGTVEMSEIMLTEGDYTNKDISYFEGMQSVKMPVLHTIGKNLFDGVLSQGWIADSTGESNTGFDGLHSSQYIKVNPSSVYTFNVESIPNGVTVNSRFYFYDKNKTYLNIHSDGVDSESAKLINIPSDAHYMKFRFLCPEQPVTPEQFASCTVQIEEGSTATPYEPYKSNILTCNEEVTLHGIGNVKDELNLLTGELTQKIGELTIDAYNTNISLHEFYDNTVVLKISTDMVSTGEKQIICDSLPTIALEDMSNGSIGVATSTTDGDSYIYVSIPTDGLTTATIQDICAYFTTNPINIKYPLATKVVSEVDLSVTDQDDVTLDSPLAYNSGNITLSSDSILPSLDYEVQSLNSFSNLKPNTTYTIKKNTQDFSSTYKIAGANYKTSNTLTTRENNEVVVLTSTISDTDKVALIEGNNIGIDIPYFEGMQSVEMPVLTTTGKNMFDGYLTIGNVAGGNGVDIDDKLTFCRTNYHKVEAGARFTVSIDGDYLVEKISEVDENKNFVRTTEKNSPYISVQLTEKTKYLRCVFKHNANEKLVLDEVKQAKIQFEYSSSPTPYEPFKSNTLTCNEEVTLRAIGDVKDELNLLTGELTQRIGEKIFENNKTYRVSIDDNTPNIIHVQLDYDANEYQINQRDGANPLVDVITNNPISRFSDNKEGIYVDANGYLVLCLSREKAKTQEEFEVWLQQNPITVQYKLATESVKTVDLSIVDQDNAPQSNLQLQTQLSHITTSSDTLIPIFNISATNNYDVQIKPSTQYTVRLSQDVVGDPLSVNLGGAVQTVTSNEFTITTPSTLVHEQLRIGGGGNVIGEIQLFEGNATGLVNEYFDGMKVSKISILTTTGENLFDLSLMKQQPYVIESDTHSITIQNGAERNVSEILGLKHEPNEQYTFTYERESISGQGDSLFAYMYTDGTMTYIYPNTINISDANKTIKYIDLTFSNVGVNKLSNICLVKGANKDLIYEPYKSNVLSIGEEIVLRSLPNGVCDTLNLVTGEYVQRIGECVLNGSEDWQVGYTSWTNTTFYCKTQFPIKDTGTSDDTYDGVYCDKLNHYKMRYLSEKRNTGICAYWYGGVMRIFVGGISGVETVEDLQTWLSKNQLTVQYELTTPIITQINQTITDQDGNAINAPLAYKNGHIQVTTSEIAPIVNYEIPTSNSYHLDLAVNGGTYTVKGDNTNELITHNSEPLISDDTHLMVIEGDCVSKDVPYFEGMTSVQTPKLIISNCPFAFGKGGRI